LSNKDFQPRRHEVLEENPVFFTFELLVRCSALWLYLYLVICNLQTTKKSTCSRENGLHLFYLRVLSEAQRFVVDFLNYFAPLEIEGKAGLLAEQVNRYQKDLVYKLYRRHRLVHHSYG
jgi:hypothetical protein